MPDQEGQKKNKKNNNSETLEKRGNGKWLEIQSKSSATVREVKANQEVLKLAAEVSNINFGLL